jgi:hypothetical protein
LKNLTKKIGLFFFFLWNLRGGEMPHLKHSNNLSTSSIVVVVLDFDPIFSLTVFFFSCSVEEEAGNLVTEFAN